MTDDQPYQFRFIGSREDLEALCQEITDDFSQFEIYLSEISPCQPNFHDREPLRQVELFDVIIKIAEAVASRAIYDVIVARLKEKAERRKLQMVESQRTPQTDVDSENQ